MSALDTAAGRVTRRITRLLEHGTHERYAFVPRTRPGLARIVDEAARGPDGVRTVGALLKLVRVLRDERGSPTAADDLVDALLASEAATRIVLTRWAGSDAQTVGADLAPRAPKQAPHVDADRPAGAVEAFRFIQPGADSRASLMRRRADREKKKS